MPHGRGFNRDRNAVMNTHRSQNTRSIAVKALNVANTIKADREVKSLVTTIEATASSTAVVQNLTALVEGATFNNRIGRKVKSVSLRVRGHIKIHGSAGTSQWRMVIVRDNLGTTTQPVLTDVYADAASFYGNLNKRATPQINARYTILYDTHLIVSAAGSSIVLVDIEDKYIKVGSFVTFTGAAATDEGKGSIYAMSASNEPTNTVAVVCEVDYKFTDP